MQYLLCPRCQFRVALNRHLCTTCGYEMPTLKQLQKQAQTAAAETQGKKSKFWGSFLGLNPQPPASEQVS